MAVGKGLCLQLLTVRRALQVPDRSGNAHTLLRKFYDTHLRGFEYTESSLHAQQRLKEQSENQPAPLKAAGNCSAIQPEDAASILGSLIGTAGLTPSEYISAVQPKSMEPPQVRWLAHNSGHGLH